MFENLRIARHPSAEADAIRGSVQRLRSRGPLQPETLNERSAVGRHGNRTGGVCHLLPANLPTFKVLGKRHGRPGWPPPPD